MGNEISARLGEIQRELKAPKGQKNSFGNYNYRSLEDIMEAIKPLLREGEYVSLSDEIVMVGDRYYVKATVNFNKGSESITATAFARESFDKKGMDSAQITGATSSYARKYACNGLFAIDDTKDADTQYNREIAKGRNIGVRVPAGYKKMKETDPEAAQKMLGGDDYFVMKTPLGDFIGTSEPETETKAFVENLGNKVLHGAPEPQKTVPESLISTDQQLELVNLAKEKGVSQETFKKYLKANYRIEGWSKLKLTDYLVVYNYLSDLSMVGK